MDRKTVNELKDKLMHSLMKHELCVYDLFKKSIVDNVEEESIGKGQAKLATMFHRTYQHCKGERLYYARDNNVDDVVSQFTYEELDEVLKSMDRNPPNRHLTLTRIVSLGDVQNALRLAGMKPWRELSYTEKVEALHSFGLAVLPTDDDEANEDISKWYTDVRPHRNIEGKIIHGICFIANERVDEEWKQSPYCSHEAKIYTKDLELARDLEGMANGGSTTMSKKGRE